MLCPGAENNTCIKKQNTVKTDSNYSFVTAVTPWQKIEEKTIYFEKSKKIEKR